MSEQRLSSVVPRAWYTFTLPTLGLLLGMLLSVQPAQAQADPPPAEDVDDVESRVKELVAAAKESRRSGRLQEAVVNIEKAYRLVPSPPLLLTLAELYLALSWPQEGLDALTSYREQMPFAAAQTEPLRELLRAQLEHKSEQRKEAQGQARKEEPVRTLPPPEPLKVTRPPRYHPGLISGLALLASGLALLSTAALAGVTLSQREALDGRCIPMEERSVCFAQGGQDTAALQDALSRQDRLTTATFALTGVSVVLIAATVPWVVVEARRQRERTVRLAGLRGPGGLPLVGGAP